jgi:hypothetical protein
VCGANNFGSKYVFVLPAFSFYTVGGDGGELSIGDS